MTAGRLRGDLDVVLEWVATEAGSWFPAAGVGAPTVRLLSMSIRPRCHAFVLGVVWPNATYRMVAKSRPQRLPDDGGWGTETRPRLAEPAPVDEDLSFLEYSGLLAAEAAVARSGDPNLRAVRVLARHAEHRTIAMEYVDQTTLRQRLHAVFPARAGGRRTAPLDRAMGSLGLWLKAFHAFGPSSPLPSRGDDPARTAELLARYADFLLERSHRPGPCVELASRAAGALCDSGTGPMAVTHGDFAPRNVFVWPAGEVAVFDPMPRWLAPAYEDVARFVVEMRTMAVHAVKRELGAAGSALTRYEQAFLHGYFGGEPVPWTTLHAYEALILLDKWAALVSRPRPTSPRLRRLHDGRTSLLERHLVHEAGRLAEQLAGPPAGGGRR